MHSSAARLLVVCGPTATGKTDTAIALARALDGEIVNADSRQVYRYMDVGTAKPTPAQRAAVPHHLLDVVDPDEPFTLADYLDLARPAITAIHERGRIPIVAGGTGLYVRALARGFAVPRVAPNPALRAVLEEMAETGGAAALLARLRRVDPAGAAKIDASNPRRLIRAVEVSEATGVPFSAQQTVQGGYETLLLGLTGPRAALHERADRRVGAMMAAGFVGEVATLFARGYDPDLPALSGLGYREIGAALRGQYTMDEAVQATKFATHRFIRRQLTWFRREPDVHWLDVTDGDAATRALTLARDWLDAPVEERSPHV